MGEDFGNGLMLLLAIFIAFGQFILIKPQLSKNAALHSIHKK